MNHLLPLTYDSESEGKLNLGKLATDIPSTSGKYHGFVIVNDTVMFAKGMLEITNRTFHLSVVSYFVSMVVSTSPVLLVL